MVAESPLPGVAPDEQFQVLPLFQSPLFLAVQLAACTAGAANSATGVTNTPFSYASVSGRIVSTNSGNPPTAETSVINFGTGSGQKLHVGAFGYVNSDKFGIVSSIAVASNRQELDPSTVVDGVTPVGEETVRTESAAAACLRMTRR